MWSREVAMSLGMRVVVAGAACVGWLAPTAPSEAGPPAFLAEARYVALGYDLGAGFVLDDPRVDVLPEERSALQRIRAGLDTWNRYVVVLRPGDADLLIAVRKGRLVSVGGGRTGTPSSRAGGGPVGTGQFANAQVSSPDDMIEVFDRSGALVWRGMKPNGLSGAGPPLWESFRAEVLKQEKRTQKP
jgi:hypothetical protein